MRSPVALILCVVACVEGRASEPASAAVKPGQQPAVAKSAVVKPAEEAELAGPGLVIEADDRVCAGDGDCTAILTQCSMCEGACTGVRVDRAGGYEGKLDCSQYRGVVCNYDRRPSFAIEAPRCVSGRCESVRIR